MLHFYFVVQAVIKTIIISDYAPCMTLLKARVFFGNNRCYVAIHPKNNLPDFHSVSLQVLEWRILWFKCVRNDQVMLENRCQYWITMLHTHIVRISVQALTTFYSITSLRMPNDLYHTLSVLCQQIEYWVHHLWCGKSTSSSVVRFSFSCSLCWLKASLFV